MSSCLRLRKILVIDDHPAECDVLLLELRKDFPELTMKVANNRNRFQDYLETCDFELAISAYSLSWTNGFEILSQVRRRSPNLPLVMKLMSEDEGTEIDAFAMGVDDCFIAENGDCHHLRISVKSALYRQDLLERTRSIEKRNHEFLRKSRIGFFQCTEEGQLINYDELFREQIGMTGSSQLEFEEFFLKLFKENNWQELFSSVVREENSQDREFKIVRLENEEDWFCLSVYLNNYSHENGVTIEGLIENISQMKKFHLKNERTLQMQSRLHLLSSREREILVLVAEGMTNKRISQDLKISSKTVEKHRSNITKKLHARNLADIVRVAVLDEQLCQQ